MLSEIEYPSFSGITSFMRTDLKSREEVGEGEYAIIGIPYDTTLGSRPGARYAPRRIREQSIHFIYHLTAIDKEVIDVCSKSRYTCQAKKIVFDTGDVRVYPSNVTKTTDSIVKEISKVVKQGAIPIIMGGDHYVTYPCVKGVEKGLEEKNGYTPKIGYIHVDSHMDSYDYNETWGKYYHGSPARRISELDSVDIGNMVWVGLNGTTGYEPYCYMTEHNGTLFTINDIRESGIQAVMEKAYSIAEKDCDYVYVTMDIDVVDQAYSSGTGSFIYGGITAEEFLKAVDVISVKDKVIGFDVVEVAPNLDPTENTARLAATALINFLKPRIFIKN